MTLQVSDVRSNDQDQIAYAVKVIGHAAQRRQVFESLHTGRQTIKPVNQIVDETGLTRKRVLEEAKDLVHKRIISQTKRDGDIAYERDGFYYSHREEILAMVRNPKKFKGYATKYSPKATGGRVVLSVPRNFINAKTITIDQIDSFSKVRSIKTPPSMSQMAEKSFKKGIQRILGEQGRFKDWGGETSDLYTTRLIIKGTRHTSAIAFKGKATSGQLTPGKMGKNGDQIQRLFTEAADVFLVQYQGQFASSVMQQMSQLAQMKSASTGKRIFYGIVDGTDSARIIAAYPRAFGKK